MAESAATSITNDNDGDARSSAKFTRCRTGCLRCRKRRRKCDERKPRCQNCIDKNFDCNYGMQVTFLPKNSITVAADELQSPTVDRSANYHKIQFVNEDPLSIDNLAGLSAETQPSSPTSTISSTPLLLSPPRKGIVPAEESRRRHSTTVSIAERERETHHNPTPRFHDASHTHREPHSRTAIAPWELDNHNHHNTSNPNANPPGPLEPPVRPNTFSAKDEFAVRGLLALGTQSGPGPDNDSIPGPVSTIPGPAENAAMGTAAADSTVGIGPEPPTQNRTIGGSGGGNGSSSISTSFIDGILGVSTPTAMHSSVLNFDIGNGTPNPKPYPNSDPVGLETWKMKLLQHYRYNVAPWLDIHDLTHSFGITALQIAVNSSSDRLLPALMGLSEACLRTQRSRVYSHAYGLQAVHFDDTVSAAYSEPAPGDLDLDVHENSTEPVLLRVFEELRSLVSDVPKAWARGKGQYDYGYNGYMPLQSMVHRAYGMDMDAAVYWMFLRMDIGKSLANNTPLRTPLPSLPIPSLALLCRTESTPERVGHYAQVLLWLCGKALLTYHQESSTHKAPGTDSWLQVFDELNQWHYLRPQEFKPMVELSNDGGAEDHALGLNSGSEFPMLLFTNGAGALCNQLYHTAMLFMLECKPRTTALLNQSHPQYSPVLSPIWHAQRVCGIALNNDRRECWDPCLLASFLVAARHMTHESQQVEIVHGFDRIQALTGWGVGEYLTQLREEWSYLDGC